MTEQPKDYARGAHARIQPPEDQPVQVGEVAYGEADTDASASDDALSGQAGAGAEPLSEAAGGTGVGAAAELPVPEDAEPEVVDYDAIESDVDDEPEYELPDDRPKHFSRADADEEDAEEPPPPARTADETRLLAGDETRLLPGEGATEEDGARKPAHAAWVARDEGDADEDDERAQTLLSSSDDGELTEADGSAQGDDATASDGSETDAPESGAQVPDDASEPDEASEPEESAGESLAEGLPNAISLDETLYRPLPDDLGAPHPLVRQTGDEHEVLRNTRDYDHDAQSVNMVASGSSFATITEERSPRDERRDPYARSERKGYVPGEGNSRSKLRPLLAMLLVAAVLGGGAAVLTYGMELWGGHKVPNVLGESQGNAEQRLEEHGMKVAVTTEPADDAIGKVLEQSPDPGVRVEEGSTVSIVVAQNRTIPEVVGLSEADARAALESAGATTIETQTKASSEPEGTVIAVNPQEGASFVSRGTVTLTLATPFRVPDVVGKKEGDAVEALKAEGFAAEVSYVTSKETVRTVVETVPAAGEVADEGSTVQVKVSTPYPTNVHHVAELLSHSSQDVDSYLQSKGFKLDRGQIDDRGNAVAIYTGKEGTLTFSAQPFVKTIALPKEGSSNVLATGAPILGVRMDCPSSMLPAGSDRAALEELAGACGLTGLDDVCDASTLVLPKGTKKSSTAFSCASGKMGNLAWTVIIVGSGKSRYAAVTCGKEGLYPAADMQVFNGSLCQFVAYQELYGSTTTTTTKSKG